MQNNINNNQDTFDNILRQKLENYQSPVDADCWTEIEERLKSKKKRKIIPFWFWLSGGAAVAMLTLLLTIHLPSDSLKYIGETKSKTIQQKKIETKQIAKHQTGRLNVTEKITTDYFALEQTAKKKQTAKEKEISQNQITNNDSSKNNKTTKEAIVVNSNKEQLLTQRAIESKDTTVSRDKPTRFIPENLAEPTKDEPSTKPKNKQNWLLAASFGSGGSISGLNSGNGYTYASNGKDYLTNASANYSNILASNDFSQKNYLSPISFGLTVRKNLNKTLGLETGLIYTYLLSTFENSGMQHSDAKLHLHYIGIPVNLVAGIWGNSKWELYLSAGAMAEKGIQSVYTQNQYFGNMVQTTTAKTKIDGLQWSVNGAVGLTYKVQRNWGIFFEPKVSYFFDNNQPVSARTENPVSIGLTAGVRLQLK
jgi:hypothetical protein